MESEEKIPKVNLKKIKRPSFRGSNPLSPRSPKAKYPNPDTDGCTCGCGCRDRKLKHFITWLTKQSPAIDDLIPMVSASARVIPNLRMRLRTFFLRRIEEEMCTLVGKFMESVSRIDHSTDAVYVPYDTIMDKLGRRCGLYPVFSAQEFDVNTSQGRGARRKMKKATFINSSAALLSALVAHYSALLINVADTDMTSDVCCVPTPDELVEETRTQRGKSPTAVAVEKMRLLVKTWCEPAREETPQEEAQLNMNLLKYCMGVINEAIQHAQDWEECGVVITLLSTNEWDMLQSIRTLPALCDMPPAPCIPEIIGESK